MNHSCGGRRICVAVSSLYCTLCYAIWNAFRELWMVCTLCILLNAITCFCCPFNGYTLLSISFPLALALSISFMRRLGNLGNCLLIVIFESVERSTAFFSVCSYNNNPISFWQCNNLIQCDAFHIFYFTGKISFSLSKFCCSNGIFTRIVYFYPVCISCALCSVCRLLSIQFYCIQLNQSACNWSGKTHHTMPRRLNTIEKNIQKKQCWKLGNWTL